MGIQSLITNYVDFNLWANQQFVNWLAKKPFKQLSQELPSSFSSLLKTMNHIWAIEAYWYSIIFQATDVENRYGVEDLEKDEVLQGLINRSKLFVKGIKNFTEAELLENIKMVSPWLEADELRYEYVLQMVNHGTYHRGQIVTMARYIGIIDVPNTDYIFFKVANKLK